MAEGGPIVVDVGQADGDGGASGVAAAQAQHVLDLDHHQVLVPGLPVHVGPGGDDDPCERRHQTGQRVQNGGKPTFLSSLWCFL